MAFNIAIAIKIIWVRCHIKTVWSSSKRAACLLDQWNEVVSVVKFPSHCSELHSMLCTRLSSELRCTRLYLKLAVFGIKVGILGTTFPQYVSMG